MAESAWVRPPYTRGLPAEDRFWSWVERTESCWLWRGTGGKPPDNYGSFCVGGRMVPAHRYSYELEFGPIPGGLLVCHRCDNPPCVNPNHLFLGTIQDNIQDRDQKGRRIAVKGEAHGYSKLTEADVREIRELREQGATFRGLARQFGISRPHVKRVVNGEVWAWLS